VSLRLNTNHVGLLLAALTCLLALNFYGWPLNRDITTYATIAREIGHGKSLYLDFFDIKPPAIFVTYMLVQSFIDDKPLQIFVLQIVPLLTVLIALLKCGPRAGFGMAAGVWAGLVWVALSGDVDLQMPWPNTELFINALVMLAMLLFLTLDGRRSTGTALTIGLLFALACLFKTVAIAMAILMGLAHLLFPPAGSNRKTTLRETLLMAASGASVIGLVVAYFAVTDRFHIFKEAMVDFGGVYAGNIAQNVVDGLTLAPFTGSSLLLRVAVTTLPWLVLLSIALYDRQHRRSWLLLGAYAFSALIAVGIPGRFYAHYFQLLVPPLCLGIGWFADFLARRSPIPKKAILGLFGIPLLVLAVAESKPYMSSPETMLRGRYAELYLETQALGRRLESALYEDEVLYQWGEESGLYWFSGKRPSASVLRFPLLVGPQAPRLTRQTEESLQARPPDLIVVVNYSGIASKKHPVYRWILSEYRGLSPTHPGERKFFTFYVPAVSDEEFVGRVLGGG
jgi:hypothetical protein